MKKISPSIQSIKLPIDSLYHEKKFKSISKSSILNNIIIIIKIQGFIMIQI